MITRLEAGISIDKPETCPPEVFDTVLVPCFAVNPVKRPTFKALVRVLRPSVAGNFSVEFSSDSLPRKTVPLAEDMVLNSTGISLAPLGPGPPTTSRMTTSSSSSAQPANVDLLGSPRSQSSFFDDMISKSPTGTFAVGVTGEAKRAQRKRPQALHLQMTHTRGPSGLAINTFASQLLPLERIPAQANSYLQEDAITSYDENSTRESVPVALEHRDVTYLRPDDLQNPSPPLQFLSGETSI